MENGQEAKTNTSGFIQMSLATLQSIVSTGGAYADLAAYIVLCSGVSGRHLDRYCTHGAKSVSDRSGISYRRAENAIEWLEEKLFIRKPSENDPQFLGKVSGRANTVRWVLDDADGLNVAVSRQFVYGVKGSAKGAPIMRMLEEISGDDEITRGQAICDAIVLYAAMMRDQDFDAFSGVDPSAWHQEFEPIEDDDDGDGSVHETPIPGTNGVMVTVKEVDETSTTWGFIYKVFSETPKDEEHKKQLSSRFWHAVRQLRNLRLIYRVLVLWQGNPLDAMQRRKSEPIATQYINDSWARQYDPHLQYEVNRAAWRSGARDAYSDFTTERETGSIPFVGSGRYRYIVKKPANNIHLVGQVRCRYWPANESTVRARGIEKTRTEKFNTAIKLIAATQ